MLNKIEKISLVFFAWNYFATSNALSQSENIIDNANCSSIITSNVYVEDQQSINNLGQNVCIRGSLTVGEANQALDLSQIKIVSEEIQFGFSQGVSFDVTMPNLISAKSILVTSRGYIAEFNKLKNVDWVHFENVAKINMNVLKTANNIFSKGDRFVELNMPQLQEISGYLTLIEADSLQKVQMPILEKIGIQFNLETGIREIEFPRLKEIGNIVFEKNPNLGQISMPLLVSGQSLSFKMSAVANGANLRFPYLHRVSNLTFSGLDKLDYISMPHLQEVAGYMEISENPELRKLHFPELESGSVYLRNNPKLNLCIGNHLLNVEGCMQPSTEVPTVSINEGALTTSALAVTLNLNSSDADEMYITNVPGCTEGGNWELYSSTKIWNLNVANDLNSVYVKFRKNSSQETSCVSDDIIHKDNVVTITQLNDGTAYRCRGGEVHPDCVVRVSGVITSPIVRGKNNIRTGGTFYSFYVADEKNLENGRFGPYSGIQVVISLGGNQEDLVLDKYSYNIADRDWKNHSPRIGDLVEISGENVDLFGQGTIVNPTLLRFKEKIATMPLPALFGEGGRDPAELKGGRPDFPNWDFPGLENVSPATDIAKWRGVLVELKNVIIINDCYALPTKTSNGVMARDFGYFLVTGDVEIAEAFTERFSFGGTWPNDMMIEKQTCENRTQKASDFRYLDLDFIQITGIVEHKLDVTRVRPYSSGTMIF